MPSLEIKVLAGAESKAFLADLTKQIDRLERLSGGKSLSGSKVAAETEDDDAPAEAEEEEDFAPKAKAAAKKTAASFEEDDAPEAAAEETEAEEEEDFTTPAPKKTKAKKLTVDDVNAACKSRAKAAGGKKGRDEVLALLQKHFKTNSVSDLKPEQFEKAIKVMEV